MKFMWMLNLSLIEVFGHLCASQTNYDKGMHAKFSFLRVFNTNNFQGSEFLLTSSPQTSGHIMKTGDANASVLLYLDDVSNGDI